ncbi:MAG TPA: hypothetical protein VGH87_16475 [Polyangiaceae bacterium]|jgi:hypothetical protein
MNAPRLHVVSPAEEIPVEVFPDPFPSVIAARAANAETDLASSEYEARERARRDLVGLATERKEQRLSLAHTESERKRVTMKHYNDIRAIDDRLAQRYREVRAAVLADVKPTLHSAALRVADDATRRSAGVGRAWRELSERAMRELASPLGAHVFAVAFFAAHGEELRHRYPDGGEIIERRAAAEAARIGDPLWFQKGRESYGWKSYTGHSHRITPQAFIADAAEQLAKAPGATSTEHWLVVEVLACVNEFIKRSKREEFPEGYAVSRVGSTGAADHAWERQQAQEREANATLREIRANAFEETLTDDELRAALTAIDTGRAA